jgi:hypothetical protein
MYIYIYIYMVGGLAGGGYIHCRGQVYAATMSSFFPGMRCQDQTAMTNLIEKLVQSDINFGEAKKGLYHCMFATFLMHLQSFVSKYTVSHLIVVKIVTLSKQFGFSYAQLVEFGALVRADFLLRNSAFQSLAASNSPVIYI